MPTLRISSEEFPRLDQLSRAYKTLDTPRERLKARYTIGREMNRAVRADGDVARDTGKFQGGFRSVRVVGKSVILVNVVRYAPYPEAGIPAARTKGSAHRAVRRAIPRIIRNTKKKHPLTRGAQTQAGRRNITRPYENRKIRR